MSKSEKPVRAIIPAAGKGSRLNCGDIPKAMFELCGKPLLEIVLENTDFISPENTYIIVGYQKEKITDYLGKKYNYVVQDEQLGTGHAVAICEELFKDFDGTVLVTFGDMPLFRKEILKKICDYREETDAACTLLTAYNDSLKDWAKVIRDSSGEFEAIIEGKDCTAEQRKTGELFAGVLAFDSEKLFKALPKLNCENAQKEFYLTDVPRILRLEGYKVNAISTDDPNDLCGVNTAEDLKVCQRVYAERNGMFIYN